MKIPKLMTSKKLDTELQKIVEARHHEPFSVLGKHTVRGQTVIRVYIPYAEQVTIAEGNLSMQRIEGTDLFEWQGKHKIPDRYRLIWRDKEHREHITHDPYCFPPQLSVVGRYATIVDI
ncbi:1,4-alpha-glucan branching enzyme, partial [Candidatus Thiomargarita nelsonii]